jgi:hypothetical protein
MTRCEDALRALEDLGGEATPGQITAATKASERTTSRALRDLREAGLVEGPESLPRLSVAARARARLLGSVAAGDFDEALEARFGPSPALCAFARTGADLIVAKHLYRGRSLYPALFAYGRISGTGKTALAEFLARSLALNLEEVIVPMGLKARGEVAGRRSGGGHRFKAVDHLGYPFVCLDELGDAEPDVRRAAQAICHGEAFMTIEDKRVEIRPTVMATWNPREQTIVLGEPYLRRGLVLCADAPGVRFAGLRGRLGDAERAGWPELGTLRLDKLRPVAPALPEQARSKLEEVFEVLTEEGRARVDFRLLELGTLGRGARHGLGGSGELARIAYWVGTDVLIVTETVTGLVSDDWGIQLDKAAAWWGDVPGLAEISALAQRRLELRETAILEVVKRRNSATVERLDFGREQEELSTTLDAKRKSLERVPPAHKVMAAGLRRQLKDLKDWNAAARSSERVAELRGLSRPVLARADSFLQEIAGEQIAVTQALREQRIAERQAKDLAAAVRGAAAAAQAAKRQRRSEIRKELASLRARWAAARRRTTTRPGEDVVGKLVELHVLRVQREGYLETIKPSRLEKLWAARRGREMPQPYSVKRVRTVLVDHAGARYSRSELSNWGTTAVLEALDAAKARADYFEDLYAETGRTVERSAPELDTGSWDPFAL